MYLRSTRLSETNDSLIDSNDERWLSGCGWAALRKKNTINKIVVSHYGATKWNLIKINVSSIPINAQVRRTLIEDRVHARHYNCMKDFRFFILLSLYPNLREQFNTFAFQMGRHERETTTNWWRFREDTTRASLPLALACPIELAHTLYRTPEGRYSHFALFKFFVTRAQSIVSSRYPAEIHTKQLKFSTFVFFHDSSSRGAVT